MERNYFNSQGIIQKKIWVHWYFAKQKAGMPKTHKMAAGGLASSVCFPMGVREQALKG